MKDKILNTVTSISLIFAIIVLLVGVLATYFDEFYPGVLLSVVVLEITFVSRKYRNDVSENSKIFLIILNGLIILLAPLATFVTLVDRVFKHIL